MPGKFYPPPLIFRQSDLGHRANSRLDLPQISRLFTFYHKKNINNIFSTQDLQDAWADRRDILHDGQH